MTRSERISTIPGRLIARLECVPAAARGADVLARMRDRQLAVLAVTESNDRMIGLVHGGRLAQQLELTPRLAERPIRELAETDYLAMPVEAGVGEVLRRALDRPAPWRTDPIVIVNEYQRPVGQLTLSALVEGQTQQIRQLEARLATAERRLHQLDEIQSRFLTNVSHEFRTPMNAILGFSELLLEHANDADRVRQYAETIVGSSERLAGLIEDVLDMARIESDQFVIQHEPTDIRSVVETAMSWAQTMLDREQVQLRSEVEAATPTWIRADALRLRQVICKLLENAIQFTPRGRIDLRVRWLAEDGPWLLIEIEDSGIGMSREQVERITESFRQGDASATRTVGGLGLGLSVSHHVIEAHGGRMTMSSRLGAGTIVRAFIDPTPLPRQSDIRATAEEAPVHLRGRVLIAEDGPDNQRLFKAVLGKAGAQVTVASNGSAAVRLALDAVEAGTPFDVILMDIQMPVMDGVTATHSIRGAGISSPIIALTADGTEEARRSMLEAGCDAFIEKPIKPASLKSMLVQYLPDDRQAA
jgi:signal transduction histidine kinase